MWILISFIGGVIGGWYTHEHWWRVRGLAIFAYHAYLQARHGVRQFNGEPAVVVAAKEIRFVEPGFVHPEGYDVRVIAVGDVLPPALVGLVKHKTLERMGDRATPEYLDIIAEQLEELAWQSDRRSTIVRAPGAQRWAEHHRDCTRTAKRTVLVEVTVPLPDGDIDTSTGPIP